MVSPAWAPLANILTVFVRNLVFQTVKAQILEDYTRRRRRKRPKSSFSSTFFLNKQTQINMKIIYFPQIRRGNTLIYCTWGIKILITYN
jgi:hypothetical protein